MDIIGKRTVTVDGQPAEVEIVPHPTMGAGFYQAIVGDYKCSIYEDEAMGWIPVNSCTATSGGKIPLESVLKRAVRYSRR